MISSSSSIKRRLIPRWRSLMRTIELGELSCPQRRNELNAPLQLPSELLSRAARWRTDPGVITAAELVESAIVHARENEAIDAARFLARERSDATPLVQKQAAIVLKRTGHDRDILSDAVIKQRDSGSGVHVPVSIRGTHWRGSNWHWRR